MVWPLLYALNHNPSLFPSPDKFLPERFRPAPTPTPTPNSSDPDPNPNPALTTFPPTAFRPFEHGPRNCIGQDLALLEIKIVLVLTLRAFDVRAVYEEFYAVAAAAGARTPPKKREEKEEEKQGGSKVGEKVGEKGVAVPHVEGEMAYQIMAATAKPKAGLPARVVRTGRGKGRAGAGAGAEVRVA